MRRRQLAWIPVLVLLLLIPAAGLAEVKRVDVATRTDFANGTSFGSVGPYEQLTGKIYFTIDPMNSRNRVIADLDKAPKNAAGLVEMSADLAILKPKDASKGNG